MGTQYVPQHDPIGYTGTTGPAAREVGASGASGASGATGASGPPPAKFIPTKPLDPGVVGKQAAAEYAIQQKKAEAEYNASIGKTAATGKATTEDTITETLDKLYQLVHVPDQVAVEAALRVGLGEGASGASGATGPGGGTATVTLAPTSDAAAATPETASFTVTLTGTGTWTAVADAAATWLTVVSPTGSQSASGTVTYALTANTGASRAGNITVGDKTFAVTQAAGV